MFKSHVHTSQKQGVIGKNQGKNLKFCAFFELQFQTIVYSIPSQPLQYEFEVMLNLTCECVS